MTTAGPNGRRRSGSGATLDQFNVADCYSQSDQADFENRLTYQQRWPDTIASMLIGPNSEWVYQLSSRGVFRDAI
ncbi:TPA: hypothetical protein ACYLIB_003967 [Burkholderia cenocepacia]|jgi:hypothetical protein|uniref:hypothetical protein n=1 Tax=Burkholderia TaxID=32008 RepID=UPI0018809261|nr:MULTISPECIES: hypothetical protein [Burkholderia]MCL4630889.1 hypothetical protein [Burkholderia sp.]MDI9695214.1 hypothetical protein [Burkholderia cenocepacia]MDN7560480.1 hypothetical protein [Burkholderia orbicola]